MDPSDAVGAVASPLSGAADSEAEMKHPLNSIWALWYFKNDKRHDWSENQKVITTFGTVEDFWA